MPVEDKITMIESTIRKLNRGPPANRTRAVKMRSTALEQAEQPHRVLRPAHAGDNAELGDAAAGHVHAKAS